jgi:2,4-dienoyl-CoA reductase (NADPH2)
VLFGPHETNLGRGRRFSDRHAAYYGRRAAGGAGVIVTEVASVHPSDWPYERAPLAAHGWGDVLAACRPHGALVLAGLGHAGGQGSSAHHQQALWAPSRVADVVSREVPMAVEQPEIDAMVAAFWSAAALAAEADLDGVEVNAGQHSILRQFLSGHDQPAHRRLRHRPRPAAARGARRGARRTGRRPDLGLRLCCDELAPWAGITPDDASATVADLAVDYLVRSAAAGSRSTRPDRTCTPSRSSTGRCAPGCGRSRACPPCCRGAWSTRVRASRAGRRGGRPGRDDPGPDRGPDWSHTCGPATRS